MFPKDFPHKMKYTHLSPDQVVSQLAYLEPFNEHEKTTIIDTMADEKYIGLDEEAFINRKNDSNEVKLDAIQVSNLIVYLKKSLDSGAKEVYFIVEPPPYGSDDDASNLFMVGTRKDKQKFNDSIIKQLERTIKNNRAYDKKREAEKAEKEKAVEKLRGLFDACLNKEISFEEFTEQSNALFDKN